MVRQFPAFFLFSLASAISFAQDTTLRDIGLENEPEEDSIVVVEEMSRFSGCEHLDSADREHCSIKEMYKFLGQNLKYPTTAIDANITGTVYVSFVINKDGSVSGVKVLRGIGGGCDEEAVRVIRSMPNWVPGKQDGKAVRVQYTIPVKFILVDNGRKKGKKMTREERRQERRDM